MLSHWLQRLLPWALPALSQGGVEGCLGQPALGFLQVAAHGGFVYSQQTARLLLGHASEHTQLHALALPGGQLPAHGGVQQPQSGFPLLLIGGAAGRRPAFLLGKYLPAQMVFK